MGVNGKGEADYYALGDWNIICSICGKKIKASWAVKNWQGMWRCQECNEPRQPQDFVRGTKDVQTVPFSQPRTSLYVQFCTINGSSAIPGQAIPGCSMPGNKALAEVDPLWPPIAKGSPLLTDLGTPLTGSGDPLTSG